MVYGTVLAYQDATTFEIRATADKRVLGGARAPLKIIIFHDTLPSVVGKRTNRIILIYFCYFVNGRGIRTIIAEITKITEITKIKLIKSLQFL